MQATYTGESGFPGVAYAGESGLMLAYTGETDHRVAYTGESTKIQFSQKLAGVGYTGESGLSDVGYKCESGLTGVGYTGESRLSSVTYTGESLGQPSRPASAPTGTSHKKSDCEC